jgi:DNA-binding transcriptional ArsR family regulator
MYFDMHRNVLTAGTSRAIIGFMNVETEMEPLSLTLDDRIGLLKALADQSRLLVVNALLEKPHCVEELSERLRRAPSTISFHLRKLEEARLVTKTKSQYYIVYQLRADILHMTLRDFVAMPCADDSADKKRSKKYSQKVISTFMRDGVLVQMPKQWRKRVVILQQFFRLFEPGQSYPEAEVNKRILTMYPDYCTLRRMLIEEGYMTRQGDIYRCVPAPSPPPVPLPQPQLEPQETRAEIKRRYKLTPTQAGIFLITNTTNGKVLVGSSTNLRGPLNKHRFLLTNNLHWIKPLQNDWNLLGPDSFTFEVVDLVHPSDDPNFNLLSELSILEQLWLEKTKPIGERGYNKDTKIRE